MTKRRSAKGRRQGEADALCCCGHIYDEHETNAHGDAVTCSVDNCRCIHFEYALGLDDE